MFMLQEILLAVGRQQFTTNSALRAEHYEIIIRFLILCDKNRVHLEQNWYIIFNHLLATADLESLCKLQKLRPAARKLDGCFTYKARDDCICFNCQGLPIINLELFQYLACGNLCINFGRDLQIGELRWIANIGYLETLIIFVDTIETSINGKLGQTSTQEFEKSLAKRIT